MKVLQINIFGNLSTGKIACQLAREYEANGDTCYVAYARGTIPNDIKSYKIGNKFDVYSHAFLSRINDSCGFHSKRATKKFVKWIKDYNPDLIHLHNIHGYYINIKILFDYLKKSNKKVYWTLHDCWAFTGHCCYFDYVKCNKWINGCDNCPQISEYPKSFVDNSCKNYEYKKDLFSSLSKSQLTLIVPSYWLKEMVCNSFLSKYKVQVVYNEVNENIFFPQPGFFKRRYKLEKYKIILGVASTWDKRKGLDIFLELSKYIGSDFKIVLIGLNKKQQKKISKIQNICAFSRTKTQKELAEAYSDCDVYFCSSCEETFGLTLLEAFKCGCKNIIGLDNTAIPEVINIVGGHLVDKKGDIISQVLSFINDNE